MAVTKIRRSAKALLLLCCVMGASCATTVPSATPAAPSPSATRAAPSPSAPGLPAAAQPRFDPAVEQRIERVIHSLMPQTELATRFGGPADLTERMRYYHTPGVSIAVINDGKIEWARGFGVRDVRTREPVTEETLFQSASISKPVFAIAVMRLVAQGKLTLDEDVNQRLRSWKVPPSGDWQASITLRQIFSHSAGTTVHGFDGYRVDERTPTALQILDGLPPANSPPVRVNILPGTQLRYSGGGITVAQLLVEGLLGEPFPRIMQELVLGPLGMAHSTYEQPLPRSFHRLAATAHPWKGDPLPGKWHVYPEMGAAGLWTTPTDLAKVGLEIQRAVRGESTFLPKALADEMLTRQMEDVGIGFFLDGKGGPIRFGHTGSNEGFMAKATFYKDLGKGAVIMVNSNEGNPLRAEIERAIAREYGWPEYFKPENPRVSLAPAALDRLGGDYETEDRIRLSVARSGESLTLTVGRQPPLPLVPSAPSKFFSPNLNLEVTFKLNGEGRAEGLVLQQEKLTLEAKRRP